MSSVIVVKLMISVLFKVLFSRHDRFSYIHAFLSEVYVCLVFCYIFSEDFEAVLLKTVFACQIVPNLSLQQH